MAAPLTYRLMELGEEARVSDLVTRVFNEFVAPDYSAEGVREFLRYADTNLMAQRSQANHFVLLAFAGMALVGADLAGMIELRDWNHISLLFVDRPYLRQGIGRGLLQRSLEICRSRQPGLAEITVNSSPYAVPIYVRLGFEPVAAEQVRNGIRFVPMKMALSPRTGETPE